MRERDDAVRCYFVPHFLSMVSQIFPASPPRRAMQIAGARQTSSQAAMPQRSINATITE